jgi:hypothetical protein
MFVLADATFWPHYGRAMTGFQHLVDRANLRNTAIAVAEPPALAPGEVRLSVDAFGFTANNITYAAVGEMIGYWTFFPAPDLGDGINWGRVPVWGFADVVESACDGVEIGERLYGYLPMSSELIITPVRVSDGSVFDGSKHRAALPPLYNQLIRCAADGAYDAKREDMQMLLRPLFMTGFLIDDVLDDNEFFGATTVVITSASSKTAYATAHILQRHPHVQVVGLTSAGNLDFVEGLNLYDRVAAYGAISDLEVTKTVLLDFSGNAGLVRSVHEHYSDALTHSAAIGVTHWEEREGVPDDLPGPGQTFFFAPTQVEKRNADWGSGSVERMCATEWPRFIDRADGWIDVEHHSGADAISDVYKQMLEGNTTPNVGIVCHP